MSLFDVASSDDDASSRGSTVSSSGSGSSLLAPPPPPPPPVQQQNTAAPGPGRNTLTEADVRSAEALRRQQLSQRLNFRGGGAPTAAAVAGSAMTPAPASSLFGNSIAAALQLRRDEAEKILLKRIQKDRERDAADATLVSKDSEVGVFVTPAYKQLLRRHRKGSAVAAALDSLAEEAEEDQSRRRATEGWRDGGEDEDEDPLEAYLRQLESGKAPAPVGAGADDATAAAAGTSTGGGVDYYDVVMRATLDDARDRQQQEQAEESDNNSASTAQQHQQALMALVAEASPVPSAAAAPSADELQSLVTATSPGSPEQQHQQQETATVAAKAQPAKSAAEEHERVLHAAREARKRRRADATFIAACALRAEERIAKRLNVEA